MQRRTSLAALTGMAAFPGAFMTTSLSSAATAPALQALKPSPRMPVMFVGHGSPMNAIEDNAWRRSWQAMGAELMARAVQPQLILCVSAHWLTRGGWQLTGMANPKTIHDFGGFPQALFDQQYPAPGAPQVARSLAALFNPVLYPGLGAVLRITQQELAYLVGLSRQRVNEALTTLAEQGVIRVEYGGLRVLDLKALRTQIFL